ncbi:hypothetical protein XH80_15695 [Bradyrhizobium sp. CCBAU 45384]|nr:hypothetical protein [Bradyrhizobium sp. CCBAU 45384]
MEQPRKLRIVFGLCRLEETSIPFFARRQLFRGLFGSFGELLKSLRQWHNYFSTRTAPAFCRILSTTSPC